jgi:hypothetical protein
MTDRIVQIRYSKDGGRNWCAWKDRSLGEAGDFLHPVILRRLGIGKHWVFQVRVTSPVRADLLAASVVIEPTDS